MISSVFVKHIQLTITASVVPKAHRPNAVRDRMKRMEQEIRIVL